MKHYEIATAIRADLLAGIATEEARAEYRYIRKTYAAERDALVTTHGKSYSPAETVADLVEAIGYENAAEIVAIMVIAKGTWDERISAKVRAWAGDLVTITPDEIHDVLGLYYSDSIHPVHMDQIARAMMAYTPAETEATEAPAESPAETEATEAPAESPAEAAEAAEAPAESPAEAAEAAEAPETTDTESRAETAAPGATFARIRSAIEASPARSAWARGVKEYAYELWNSLTEAIEGGYFDFDDLAAPKLVARALLNGASDWGEYSWGGCALIYNEDIARRLCSPSELKRTRDGERRPNAREEWLDTQARALYQASDLLRRIIKEEVGA